MEGSLTESSRNTTTIDCVLSRLFTSGRLDYLTNLIRITRRSARMGNHTLAISSVLNFETLAGNRISDRKPVTNQQLLQLRFIECNRGAAYMKVGWHYHCQF